jgi:hypothetical protein
MATSGNYGSAAALSPARVTALPGIEHVVLGPLRGRPEADWDRAPAGKWTPAQIVEHLALAFDLCVQGFEPRLAGPPAPRRPKTLLQHVGTFFVFGLRWAPPVKSTRRATPAPRVVAADAERHFLAGLAAWRTLTEPLDAGRRQAVFLKHPRLGELNVDEWARFHVWHCHHHARQIVARLGR